MQQTTYFDSLMQETTNFEFMKKQTTDFELVTQQTIEFDLVTQETTDFEFMKKQMTDWVGDAADDRPWWLTQQTTEKSTIFVMSLWSTTADSSCIKTKFHIWKIQSSCWLNVYFQLMCEL